MFKELFKAELAVRGIVGKRADQVIAWYENPDTVSFPLSAEWDEQKHPRDKGGQFTIKGFREASGNLIHAANEDIYKKAGRDSPSSRSARSSSTRQKRTATRSLPRNGRRSWNRQKC